MPEEELIISDLVEVKSEITSLKLDIEKLADIARYAHSEGSLCTNNDQKGFRLATINSKVARGLRENFCGEDWVHDESGNQPGILNEAMGIRIIPCNFDENAGNLLLSPTNRSDKGAASSSKVRCNGTGWLPGLDFSVIEGDEGKDVVTLVFGVYSEGNEPIGAELSYPIGFSGTKYTQFSKRIIVLNAASDGESPTSKSDLGEPTEVVEIDVKRKE